MGTEGNAPLGGEHSVIRDDDERSPCWDIDGAGVDTVRGRRAGIATFGAWTGTAVLTCGLVSVFFAGTHATPASAAKRACATHPAAAARLASALNAQRGGATALAASASGVSGSAAHRVGPGEPARHSSGKSGQVHGKRKQPDSRSPSPSTSAGHDPSPSASPSKSSPSPSPSPSASPSKSASKSPSPRPTISSSPNPSPSSLTPSPSKSGPSPSKSPKPSTSPSPTSTPANSRLCVSVQPFSSSAQVRRGHTATYIVWVWSTHGSAKQIAVSASIRQVKGAAAPQFSVCPDASGATCALGNLPQGQADELQVRVAVRKDAKPGDHLTLIAKAKAKDAASFSATGSVKIVAARKPAPLTTSPAPSTSPPPPLPTIPAPAVPNPLSTRTNPSGLFPTVSPQPATSPSRGSLADGRKDSRGIRATSASDTLPLNMRLIGGQLAGLVVLAAAITIAITRLSIRPQRPQDAEAPPAEQ